MTTTYNLNFYPKEIEDSDDIEPYFGSICDIPTLEKAKQVMELYVSKGFNVALWMIEQSETRIMVVKDEQKR